MKEKILRAPSIYYKYAPSDGLSNKCKLDPVAAEVRKLWSFEVEKKVKIREKMQQIASKTEKKYVFQLSYGLFGRHLRQPCSKQWTLAVLLGEPNRKPKLIFTYQTWVKTVYFGMLKTFVSVCYNERRHGWLPCLAIFTCPLKFFSAAPPLWSFFSFSKMTKRSY